MKKQETIAVRVAAIEQASPLVKHFALVPVAGGQLPAFSGGSHVVVHMKDGARTHKNPYSLCGSSADRSAYHIGVRRQEDSRGGSQFMHDQVRVGDVLHITPPNNLFAIDSFARRHILIAGGIGITPFMSQMHDLRRTGADYELHYAVRSREHAAFWDVIARDNGERAVLHTGDRRLDIPALLARQPVGTHVYVCGPAGMVEAVKTTAKQLGWSASHVHSEEFSAPVSGDAYTAVLARSGIEVHVEGQQSMLEAIEAAGVEAPYMCRGGVCGFCETALLEGTVDHHDHFLTDEDKASMKKVMICVSRAACERIVIDL